MIEKTSPSVAASTVRTMATTITVWCFRTVAAELRLQQLEHVRPDGIELVVEIVAQHVAPIELIGHCFLVTAVEERQQACDLLVEAAVRIVHQVDQAGIEPHQS